MVSGITIPSSHEINLCKLYPVAYGQNFSQPVSDLVDREFAVTTLLMERALVV